MASRRHPGRYWTHNDSGDEPIVFCVQDRGEPCGAWRVRGAQARDWEGIAAGPGPEPGTPYLYVGDIGDNLDDLDQVVVYRVAEPEVPPGPPAPRFAPLDSQPAEALRLRYPDGPHNAEALLVHPETGDIYVVTKDEPAVYVARAPVTASAVTAMETLAQLDSGDDIEEVTGGDIAPDGTRVILCTYAEGYEFQLPAGEGEFDAIWRQSPRRVDLGVRAQGESVAYRLDGRALLTTSERGFASAVPLQQVERR